MECQYCSKIFSTKGNLKHHQATAKYCIKIQGIQVSTFCCKYCSKLFTDKVIYKRHGKCKQYYIYEYEQLEAKYEHKLHEQKLEYQSQIATLQNELASLARTAIERPTTSTTTNNTIINIAPFSDLSPKRIEQMIEKHYTEKLFLRGQEGVGDLVGMYILKDDEGNMYAKLSDIARCYFKLMGDDGKMISDFKAQKITSLIIEPILSKSLEHLHRMEDDYMIDRATLYKIHTEIKKLEAYDNLPMRKQLAIHLT
jgi:hypothetical protein